MLRSPIHSGKSSRSAAVTTSQFKTAPVSQEVADAAARIYRRWSPSHGKGVADAILAATVRSTGGKLYSLNTRHFPLDDIVVEWAWAP